MSVSVLLSNTPITAMDDQFSTGFPEFLSSNLCSLSLSIGFTDWLTAFRS